MEAYYVEYTAVTPGGVELTFSCWVKSCEVADTYAKLVGGAEVTLMTAPAQVELDLQDFDEAAWLRRMQQC